MKYYRLTNSLDIHGIGKYPQSTGIKLIGYNTSEVGFKGPVEVPVVPPEAILQTKAKATTLLDIVSIDSLRFLVLKLDFINFIKEFKLKKFQYWNIRIHHKESVLKDYRLFYLCFPSDRKYVDYANSEILIGKLGDWENPGIRKPVNVYEKGIKVIY